MEKNAMAFGHVIMQGVGRELIEACMRNERRAQQRLYERLHSRLMNICLRYTKDEEEARSHFIQGFLKILTNINQFTFEGLFESWASRVMINSIIDTLRQKKRYTQAITLVQDNDVMTSDVTLNEFELRAGADDVLALVKKLPEATRDVFLLYAVDGYTHHEIAHMLNIAEGTSKWHVSEARKRLTGLITEQYKRIHANESKR
jgi:RNA polymerase sigma factor (sigma-70 family)